MTERSALFWRASWTVSIRQPPETSLASSSQSEHRRWLATEFNYSQARRISAATFATWTRRMKPGAGDLLLAREAPVGPVVMIPTAENVAPGQRTVLMRPNPRAVDSRYLYLALSAPATQLALQEKAAGSTVAHLNVADIRSFRFPWTFPSLHTQRAIAEVLGALDDKIAANTAVSAQAQVLGRDDRHPPLGLRTVFPRSGERSCRTPDRSNPAFWSGRVRWVSAKDITAAPLGVILSTAELNQRRGREVVAGQACSGGIGHPHGTWNVGAVARLAVEAAFNQSCYAFIPSDSSFLRLPLLDGQGHRCERVVRGPRFSVQHNHDAILRRVDRAGVPEAQFEGA